MKKLIIYIVFFNIVFNNTISVPRDFNTIQQAIDISVNGDTVVVSPGTYNENINFIGKSIVLIGEDINTTILNGNQNSSVVTFENNEDSNSILDRFSITNGRSQYGGGIYISNANPKIQNVKIYQNFSEDGGGGGLYCVDSSPNLFNVQIYDNNSNDVGGGIYLKGSSSPVCTKIAIYNNYSNGAGGGMFVRDSGQPHLNHATIILNQTETWGGGIAGKYGVDVKITNSIIRSNSPQQLAMSQYDDNQNIFLISTNNIEHEADSILTGNNDSVFWLDGNFDLEPLFIEGELLYEIGYNSPCVDVGIEDTLITYNNNQNSLYIEPYDFEGLSPDIGAFEFKCEFPSYYDDCGVCSLGDTGHEPNSDMDDCGVCFGNNDDLDCAGVCFGNSYYDDCDVCDDIVENDNECITTVKILDSTVASGSNGMYQISLSNTIGIAGFQFQIEDQARLLNTINIMPTNRADGFSTFFNEVGSDLYIAGFHSELRMIEPGSGPILEVFIEAPVVDQEIDVQLSLLNIVLSDNNANPVEQQSIDGTVTIVMDNILLGDINNDEIINVLDAILLVEIIIYENDYNISADLNEDNIINVLDIVLLVEIILSN